jgi:short-subunit dehydrogenase
MSQFNPSPRLAVVTGASSGIGAVYADRLAQRGHSLLLIARRADRLDAVASSVRARSQVNVETRVANLEDAAQLADIEAHIASAEVDLVVNNAGAGGLGQLSQVSADTLERMVKLNVVALTRLSHAALRGFRARGSGVLINIGSVMAYAPSPGGAAYSGSKAYVLNFTRSLQLEYAASSIRVQLVMPGPIRTEFFSSQGISDSVFHDHVYLTADQLVDAALAGLDAGEAITTPSLQDLKVWETLEASRAAFMTGVLSGAVAQRYLDANSRKRPVR